MAKEEPSVQQHKLDGEQGGTKVRELGEEVHLKVVVSGVAVLRVGR